MPSVVPSEIVRAIDRFFPFASRPEKPPVRVGIDEIGRLSAIVALLDRLPQELLVLPPTAYTDFLADLEMLRSKVSIAAARGQGYSFSGEPVWKLRHALAKCPDSAPTRAANELRFVRPRAFRDDLRRDLTEAYLSLNEGRWKSATVLAGAVIEALLVCGLSRVPASDLQAAVVAAIPERGPKGPPEGWSLWQLIPVAEQLKVITSDTATQLRLAKTYRNLIHPGRTLRTGERCGKDTALGTLAGVERVIREMSK